MAWIKRLVLLLTYRVGIGPGTYSRYYASRKTEPKQMERVREWLNREFKPKER